MLLDRNTRVQKLQEARKILKEEFIGLDSIIDQVVNSVSPWYITPEILTRPTVVSIWGMTGTGKSSAYQSFYREIMAGENDHRGTCRIGTCAFRRHESSAYSCVKG